MFKKHSRKISKTMNMANFIWNLHKKLLQPEKSRKLRCWDLFGQIVFESFWKLLKAFWKPLETGYFPLECPSEVIIAYAISKRSKFEFFQKKDVFLRKRLRKTSGALFGVFHRDCVSDFHIASEFSKQSNIWFVWRNRCCLWKDPCFPLESVNVAFFSKLAFQKN